jgi:hypothetical protein
MPTLGVTDSEFKAGDIVWVNLGISYGWWPGEYQEIDSDKKLKLPKVDFMVNNQFVGQSSQVNRKPLIAQIRFFDDDKYDLLNVTDASDIKSYSCSGKKELVLLGMAKFSSDDKKKSGSMFDFRARQAQFYKDVEMAEVMTDNDSAIADILAEYEVVETPDEVPKPPKKKRRRKR